MPPAVQEHQRGSPQPDAVLDGGGLHARGDRSGSGPPGRPTRIYGWWLTSGLMGGLCPIALQSAVGSHIFRRRSTKCSAFPRTSSIFCSQDWSIPFPCVSGPPALPYLSSLTSFPSPLSSRSSPPSLSSPKRSKRSRSGFWTLPPGPTWATS